MTRDDARARLEPETAVDALEDDVLGAGQGAQGSSGSAGSEADDKADGEADDGAVAPAFELDLDPEQQGSADGAAANPD